jgi:hypothetical protein
MAQQGSLFESHGSWYVRYRASEPFSAMGTSAPPSAAT